MHKSYQEPLLYIMQPPIKAPEAVMQQSYYSRKKKQGEKHDHEKKLPLNSSFHTLSLEEKIDYLLKVAKSTAPLKCEISLEKKVERGIVLSASENQIKLRTLMNDIKTIAKDEIKQIKLIGF